MLEGLYTGLGSGAGMSSLQLESKMKLLVEAPAAVEDALASLLDHHDIMLQARLAGKMFPVSMASCMGGAVRIPRFSHLSPIQQGKVQWQLQT